MSRVIKFRGWHPEAKAMTEPFGLGCSRIKVHSADGDVFTWEAESGFPVMQFTGLLDKNGVEIFDGDIVECRNEVQYSEMEEKYGDDWPEDSDKWIYKTHRDVVTMERFPVFWLKGEEFGYEGDDLIRPSNCFVVGNIHENPELLV
jgi:uncharacterized phage protein (TIGR01671 family)